MFNQGISLVESKTFWAAFLVLLAQVAAAFHWSTVLGFATDPNTVNGILQGVSIAGAFLAIVFRGVAKAPVISVFPVSSPAKLSLRSWTMIPAIIVTLAVMSLISGCATAPDGDYTVAGQDIGFGPTQVAVVDADVQTAIKALPSICAEAAVGQAVTAADIAILQSTTKLPAKTAANLVNSTATIVKDCAAIAASTQPLVQ